MKIVYFAKTTVPAPTANSLHVMKMCQAFARNGHDVCLCVLDENYSEYDSNEILSYYDIKYSFKLLHLPVFPDRGSKIRFLVSHLHMIPGVFGALRKLKPDMVYGRDMFSCFLASCLGAKVVAESHFPVWNGKIAAFSFATLLKRNNFFRLVVISNALKKAYLDHYQNLADERIRVAHDGADPIGEGTDSVKCFGTNGNLQVGYVGHLYPGKGVEVIAAVAPKMVGVDFHIIGGLEDDIEKWKQQITAQNVIFHGFVQQNKLPDYINGLDVCLLPNQYKVLAHGADPDRITKNISQFTSPLKMFDYMAYAKAIISSDIPVLREVLNEDVAIFVKPDDYLRWIEAIDLLRDDAKRKRMGNRAQRLFLDKYTWQKRAALVLGD